MSDPILFEQLQKLTTEKRNPKSMDIDVAPLARVLEIIHEADREAVDSVTPELPYVAKAVEILVDAFQNGGRLFYAGAGTSGRLGVLDASECPPTFGTDPEQFQGLIAGGQEAMFKAQEGAEDHESYGADAIDEAGVTSKDVVCGIAASRRTPYVAGAVQRGKEIGARTLFVTCNPRDAFEASDLDAITDVAMCADVGPEVIMGSTRMKSGTATKLILNMLSTASMVRMGKVYENMMVDLQMTNAKLVERSRRIVMTASGVDYDAAGAALDAAGGHVKTALVMLLADVDAEAARQRIEAGGGFVRHAIQGTAPEA
ncbi:N-acetylmuramic acid 6-phosphate etherase [Rubricoccus marinus]|uniref:N-acetylmuramic acid 6-phosphate etherase n=1 Tax=Rubricoccus marinus TaxID=716817 RepID=A0A259U2P9_9BACT|nr:N-acetylmuramic acid 6-phosphate etherase [Rubricoccus marinus]OZC04252.1 N-acetylmuramic acid 6-phosphate etherase [Rubricoccus marinus]